MTKMSHSVAIAIAILASGTAVPQAEERDPIAFVGHGAFFDADGKEVAPTPGFVARAQAFYRKKLLDILSLDKKKEFLRFQKQLDGAVNAIGQAKLVVDQRALDWLATNVPNTAVDAETIGKIGALRYVLT